jgi:hypothetical protein
MKIPLTYEEATERYPDLVDTLMEQFRADEGKSKTKVLKGGPETIEWYIDYGVRIGPNSQREREQLGLTAWCDKNIKASFSGTVNRYWHGGIKFEETPQEILDAYKESERIRGEEQRRIAALSPKERLAEMNAALRELRGTPGFVEIRNGQIIKE